MLIGISDQMGTRFDRLRYEVFQNLILSPMNTGLLRPAVATVLTVYGIETITKLTILSSISCNSPYRLRYWNLYQNVLVSAKSLEELQQSLPFTVLKLNVAYDNSNK